MKNLKLYILFVLASTLVVSCSEYSRKPGKVYAPDMFYSRAVDFYNGTEKIEAQHGAYNKMPANGTVAREQALPDHIAENDTMAAKAQTCSYTFGEKDVEEGKRLYLIYCGICHGEQMDGNGPLFASGKFAAMPANLKSGEKYLKMSQGQIYHAIMYGKNTMGSYASQLDTKQRWKVVAYIKKIQSENGGEAFTMVKSGDAKTDTTKVTAKVEAEKPADKKH